MRVYCGNPECTQCREHFGDEEIARLEREGGAFYAYETGTPSGDLGCEVWGTMKDGVLTINDVKYHPAPREGR